MHITVHYLAQLRRLAGCNRATFELAAPASLSDLLRQLAERQEPSLRSLLLDDQGQRQRSLLVFLGEEQIPLGFDRLLSDGDEITLLTPMAGG